MNYHPAMIGLGNMKLAMTVVAAGILLNGAAFAEEAIEQPKPRVYTTDEINKALRASGQPPLGSSRVLYNENRGATRSTGTTTIRQWSSSRP
jgi:hypothetical protein